VLPRNADRAVLLMRMSPAITAFAELRENLRSAKKVAQFVFGPLQHALLFLRKIFAGAVDVKVQHRHRRLIWFGFTPLATLGRAFQRERDFSRLC